MALFKNGGRGECTRARNEQQKRRAPVRERPCRDAAHNMVRERWRANASHISLPKCNGHCEGALLKKRLGSHECDEGPGATQPFASLLLAHLLHWRGASFRSEPPGH